MHTLRLHFNHKSLLVKTTCCGAIRQRLTVRFILGALCNNKEEAERHLEMGKKMLSAGQLADALSHYHAAVGGFSCRHTRLIMLTQKYKS